MPTKIVHIGFPKTATTFLQWSIFPNLKGVEYVNYAQCRSIFQPLIYSDPLDYSIEAIQDLLVQSELPTLYSFESLAGSPFYYKGIGRSAIAHSLKSLGFDKVIITIRKQTKAIDSYYRQYVVQGGTLSFRNWLDLSNRRPIPQKYFLTGYLEYDKLIDHYLEVFGQENVLVLSQEELQSNKFDFLRKIESFTHSHYIANEVDSRANTALTNLSILLLRFINHFTYSSVRPFHLVSNRFSNRLIWKFFAVVLDPYIFKFFSKRKSFLEKYSLIETIESIYEKSNKKLEVDCNIDFTTHKK